MGFGARRWSSSLLCPLHTLTWCYHAPGMVHPLEGLKQTKGKQGTEGNRERIWRKDVCEASKKKGVLVRCNIKMVLFPTLWRLRQNFHKI